MNPSFTRLTDPWKAPYSEDMRSLNREAGMNVRVKDSFEIKPGMPGTKHAPGVVLVFDVAGKADIPRPGSTIQLKPPHGHPYEVVVGASKKRGLGRSFFIEGLTRADAPVGSSLRWPVPLRTTRTAKSVKTGSSRRR
jgi:hypothetical protein